MRADVEDGTETERLGILERYDLSGPGPSRAGTYFEDLDNLVTLAAEVCGVPYAVINIITADEQNQIAARGVPASACSREDSMCAQVFKYGQTIVVEDCRLDARFSGNPFVTGDIANVRFYASTPLKSSAGHPLGTLCVFDDVPGSISSQQAHSLEVLATQIIDILDLQLRTRQLSVALEELGRSNELLAEFAGRVSHDLQGPLTSIRGFAELAELDLSSPGAAARHLQRIIASAERMTAMIDELLGFAQANGALRLQEVSVAAVTTAVREDLSSAFSKTQARLDVEDFRGRADPSQLHTLLQNLLHNALNYAHPERRPQIRISAQGTADRWQLQVADNGLGIRPEHRQRALEPLVRLNTTAAPGTGLGLATCNRIAQAHGGHLELDETPGGGLTVKVWFGVDA